MSRYRATHVLTAERLADLRRIAAGVTRVAGAPWELNRIRIEWFAREGYLQLGPCPAPSDAPRQRVRRDMTLTDKARAAIAHADDVARQGARL